MIVQVQYPVKRYQSIETSFTHPPTQTKRFIFLFQIFCFCFHVLFALMFPPLHSLIKTHFIILPQILEIGENIIRI